MGLTFKYEMYGQPEDDDDFLRRIRFGIDLQQPIPPITESVAELGVRSEILSASIRRFRRDLVWTLCRQKPNNWLKRHGIPMRRKGR